MTPESRPPEAKPPGRLYRAWDSDLAYAFRTAPVAIVATAVVLVVVVCAVFAPLIAPMNPYDSAALNAALCPVSSGPYVPLSKSYDPSMVLREVRRTRPDHRKKPIF